MDITPLPFLSGLEQYKKQAKELLKAFRSGDPDALRCIGRYHPSLPGRANSNDRDKLSDSAIRSTKVSPADARFVVARWYGFGNWPKLAEFVKVVIREGSSVWQFESAGKRSSPVTSARFSR